MNSFIAYCGLDCESCEARMATMNNDDTLRKKVAKLWSELHKDRGRFFVLTEMLFYVILFLR